MTHKCNKCGVTLEVEVQQLAGHMESEEYYCPACGTEYKARSANTPNVRIINENNDNNLIQNKKND